MGRRKGYRFSEEDVDVELDRYPGSRKSPLPSLEVKASWHHVLLTCLFLFLFWRAYIDRPTESCPVCEDCSVKVKNALLYKNDMPQIDEAVISKEISTDPKLSQTGVAGEVIVGAENTATTTLDGISTIQEPPAGSTELSWVTTVPTISAGAETPVGPQQLSEPQQAVEQQQPIGPQQVIEVSDAARAERDAAVQDSSNLIFYGQDGGGHNFPDKVAFEAFFQNPPLFEGTFVEFGAQDGVTRSNTYFFEETMLWTGLLVEAAPANFEKLKANHLNKRKHSQIYQGAICDEIRTVKFIGEGGTAGRLDRLAPSFIEKWSKHWKEPWNTEYDVSCDSAKNILANAGIKKVDFMSIDVEGSEIDVISSIDFKSVDVRVLLTEIGMDAVRDAMTRDTLVSHGFCHAFDVSTNQFWVKDPELAKKFCTNL